MKIVFCRIDQNIVADYEGTENERTPKIPTRTKQLRGRNCCFNCRVIETANITASANLEGELDGCQKTNTNQTDNWKNSIEFSYIIIDLP